MRAPLGVCSCHVHDIGQRRLGTDPKWMVCATLSARSVTTIAQTSAQQATYQSRRMTIHLSDNGNVSAIGNIRVKSKPIVGQGTTHDVLPDGEPSSQHPDDGDSRESQRGGTIEPRVDEGHLPSPLVNSTNPTKGDDGHLGRKKRGVQIIDDDGCITDELIIQDNGRLASTRTDIPIIPAPDDGDVTDWMRDVFGQIENDDEYMWQDIELANMTRHTVISNTYDTVRTITQKFDPPIREEHLDLYRKWLVENSPVSSYWTYDMLPMRRRQCVKPGLHFIPPTGANWEAMLVDHTHKTRDTSSKEVQRLLNSAMA